ncbi:glycosyltransferase [Kovacikia minuta CCNUW1]|uniref:glycosyltransferase n=1 Tax=Kovacikia minuta TaxID=2931930 RepID=UPI001CCC302B|nr:glycosyltransferase [Kovacikia minuta]UBF27181.1 glycosyltransferase [Kovacikia minuta CCNUW1]
MSSSRFTFCIPNLNKMRYLPACIASVLAQDYQDWRCVFVDGYSTDGSWEYMQQFADDRRFLLLRGLRQGMYADWNECLRHVETDYFYFLTSDDTCFPTLASTTIAALDAHPNLAVCHFKFAWIDEAGVITRSPETITQVHFDLYQAVNQSAHVRSGLCEFFMHFLYRNLYMTITALVFRRSVIDQLKGFTSLYGAVGDYDWTMRLGLTTDVLYLPELLATWRVYEGQATDDCTSPQVTEKLLTIAQTNLDRLVQSQPMYPLKRPINRNQMLSDLRNEHAAALYKQVRRSKSIPEIQKNLYPALKQCPLYPVKKLLRRLSGNRLYSYQPEKAAIAHQWIEQYGLDFVKPRSPDSLRIRGSEQPIAPV